MKGMLKLYELCSTGKKIQNRFPFLRRPYKIILQKGKNNQMKVLEQCIESGKPDVIYFQAARS